MLYATLAALLFGLGCVLLLWKLTAPATRTIAVKQKEKRWINEDRWVGRYSTPLEVAAYFLTDAGGAEFRVTKQTYLEVQLDHPITLAQRGRCWTRSAAQANEPCKTLQE